MKYTKLPAKKKGSFKSYSLWLGRDHLLAVESLYSEEYRRFNFSEIQGFVIRKTAYGLVTNLVFGTLLAIGGLFMAGSIVDGSRGGGWAWGMVCAVFALLLGINVFRGTTCATHLQTDLAEHRLPSLDRVRKTWKVIGLVRPLIEQAQGRVTREQIQRLTDTETTRVLQARAAEERDASAENKEPATALNTYRGGMHWALFCMLFLTAAATGLHFFHPATATYLVRIFANVGVLLFSILCLGMQSGSRLPRSLRSIPVASMLTVVVAFLITYFYALVQSMAGLATQMANPYAQYTFPSAISPSEHGFLTVVYLLSIALMLTFCGVGVSEMVKWKQALARMRRAGKRQDR